MALRRQASSPTANLLRNSRLFSIPNPLPRPQVAETYGAGTIKVSNTATIPFPTHQAIATTPSSLARGDWGLKRPIPSRSHIVQTSNPVLRIKQLDTVEHVTDFDSAADHVRTRQKWEELGVPMMRGMDAMRDTLAYTPPNGAFEHRSDVTSYENDEGLDQAGLILETIKKSVKANAEEQIRARKAKKADPNAPEPSFVPYSLPLPDPVRHNARRWKHEGPWLPGMSAQEFTDYISTPLRNRKKEFATYLEQYVKNEIYTMRQNTSRKEELPLDAAEAEEAHVRQEKEWSNISKADVAAGIKNMRQEAATNPLTSRLVQRLIIPFLRLPSIKFKNTTFSEDNTKNDGAQYRFDDDSAPLSTHPSSGLGYLRTNSYLSNHPILGPQGERTPVKARVIQTRITNSTHEPFARLGIAGFVTNDAERSTHAPAASAPQSVDYFDWRTEGGAKLNVLPRFASVTNDGRIHIKVARSHGAEAIVARGELSDRPPVRQLAETDPLADLSALTKPSGGRVLGEKSDEAQRVASMIQAAAKQHEETRSMQENQQGVADALGSAPSRRR